MARRRSLPHPTRRQVVRGLGAGGLLLRCTPLGLVMSCDDAEDDDEDPTEDPTGDEVLRFAVITDPHLKAEADHPNNLVLAETVEILNAVDPPVELVLLTGDLLDDLPSDEPSYYEEHDHTALHQLETLLEGLAIPRLAVLGNHDYYIQGGGLLNDLTDDLEAREALLEERLDLPGLWFRHDHRGIAFYGLNTMQPHPDAGWLPESCGSFGPEQLAWLEQQLADGVPSVLFFHHALALDNAVAAGFSAAMPFEVPRAEGDYAKYEGTEYEDWTDPIYALLDQFADQILAIFVGHGHWFVRDELGSVPVMMTDSVGNSVLQTSIGEGDEAEPMRYHLVECDLGSGTLSIANEDWFSYEPSGSDEGASGGSSASAVAPPAAAAAASFGGKAIDRRIPPSINAW